MDTTCDPILIHRTFLRASAVAPLAAVGDHGHGALVMSQNKQSTTNECRSL